MQIKEMDTVCLNTIHSTLIKETFASYVNNTSKNHYEQSKRKNTLANAITATKGVDSSIRQVNIYGFHDGSYGAGNFTGVLDRKASQQSWFEDTFALHGHRYIPPASQNIKLSRGSGTDLDRYYLSLYRMYFDEYQNPSGFVEVMKYYDILFENAFQPESDYDIDIVIYDSEGNVIFPLDTKGLFPYYSHKNSNGKVLYNS